MYKEVYQILEIYNKDKKYVDEDFIKTVFEIVRDSKQLNNYVKDPEFNRLPGSFANYDNSTKKMIFDLSKPRQSKIKKDLPDLHYLFYNGYILLDIYHEFVHVNQGKIVEEYNPEDLLFFIIYNSVPYVNKYDLFAKLQEKMIRRYYRRNWHLDPCERMANLLGGNDTINTIKEIPEDILGSEQLLKVVTLETKNHLVNNYKLRKDFTNSPTINYLRGIPFSNNKSLLREDKVKKLFTNPSLTYEDRLLYGLSLTKGEYLDIKADHDNYRIDTRESFESLIKTYYKR
jgi:hypothetical protein